MVIVEGKIRGKDRPRFNTRTGRTYTTNNTKTYENSIKSAYIDQCNINHGEYPVRARIEMYFEVPKSYSKKRVELIKLGKEQPTKKPDTDNTAKVVLDSLNGIAYKDDAQVIELTVIKRYTLGSERVEFEIERL